MQTQDEEYLLTRDDVETRFGISKRHLEVADTQGKGPKRVLLGRSVRYRVRDIRDYIESCTDADESAGARS